MKVKMKFDLAQAKGWLFEHGEKVAFGAMVLVFLLFIYSALQREVLEASKQPDKLQQAASEVTQHISASKWDDKNSTIQVVDYQKRAQIDKVPADAFAISVPLAHPVFDPKGKREDPEIFAAEEVRIAAGAGSFAIRNEAAPAAGSATRGAATSATPGKGKGVRPSQDSTLKAQAWVVVTGLVPVEKQAAEYKRIFSRALGDSADRDVLHYGRPKVERALVDPAKPDQLEGLEWKEVPSSEAFEATWDVPGEDIVMLQTSDESFTARVGPLVDAPWDLSVAHPKIRLVGETITAADAAITHKLFRFFDYTAEPNRQYRYRFKMAVHNPNYHVDRKFLKNPEAPTNSQEIRYADEWSQPTDIVAVPSGFGVLAGTVEPKASEPSANLLLTGISPKDGIPASAKLKVFRGSIAHKRESKVRAGDPRNNGKPVVIDEMEFKPNMVVLDIFGGKTISYKRRESAITSPGEVLLVDEHGNLVVHSDLDDHTQYDLRKPPEEAEPVKPEKDKIPDEAKTKKSRKK